MALNLHSLKQSLEKWRHHDLQNYSQIGSLHAIITLHPSQTLFFPALNSSLSPHAFSMSLSVSLSLSLSLSLTHTHTHTDTLTLHSPSYFPTSVTTFQLKEQLHRVNPFFSHLCSWQIDCQQVCPAQPATQLCPGWQEGQTTGSVSRGLHV